MPDKNIMCIEFDTITAAVAHLFPLEGTAERLPLEPRPAADLNAEFRAAVAHLFPLEGAAERLPLEPRPAADLNAVFFHAQQQAGAQLLEHHARQRTIFPHLNLG